MQSISPTSLIKPTADTPFSIDFDWWERQNLNWKVLLRNHLCEEHQKTFSETTDDSLIDWVDPMTAEITVVDGIQQALMKHCSKLPDFFKDMPIVDSLFFALLVHGNKPLSANQMADIIGLPAVRILQVIGGNAVQKGIRPHRD